MTGKWGKQSGCLRQSIEANIDSYVLRSLCTALRAWLFASASERVVARLRKDLFSHLTNQVKPVSQFHEIKIKWSHLSEAGHNSKAPRIAYWLLMFFLNHTKFEFGSSIHFSGNSLLWCYPNWGTPKQAIRRHPGHKECCHHKSLRGTSKLDHRIYWCRLHVLIFLEVNMLDNFSSWSFCFAEGCQGKLLAYCVSLLA